MRGQWLVNMYCMYMNNVCEILYKQSRREASTSRNLSHALGPGIFVGSADSHLVDDTLHQGRHSHKHTKHSRHFVLHHRLVRLYVIRWPWSLNLCRVTLTKHPISKNIFKFGSINCKVYYFWNWKFHYFHFNFWLLQQAQINIILKDI